MEYSYQKLDVYKVAKEFVKAVYALLKKYPAEEKYALCDQIRRATISVPSNIAEGMGRSTNKDQAHFLEIAYGSLMEVQCQLDISVELGYIEKSEFNNIDQLIHRVAMMINSLHTIRTGGVKRVCSKPTLTHINPN